MGELKNLKSEVLQAQINITPIISDEEQGLFILNIELNNYFLNILKGVCVSDEVLKNDKIEGPYFNNLPIKRKYLKNGLRADLEYILFFDNDLMINKSKQYKIYATSLNQLNKIIAYLKKDFVSIVNFYLKIKILDNKTLNLKIKLDEDLKQ